jgi:hypothetical protein
MTMEPFVPVVVALEELVIEQLVPPLTVGVEVNVHAVPSAGSTPPVSFPGIVIVADVKFCPVLLVLVITYV